MAAKKKTAKKTAKKVTKKVVKKAAKKVTKKVAKKAAKKVTKKVVKKAAKKVTKKVAKKVTKKVAKKAVKSTATKIAKKVAKKVAKEKVTKAAPVEASVAKPAAKLTGFSKKQYQRLLDLRDGIMDAMSGITNDTLKNTDGMETGGGGMHTGDAGSDSYDRDFALNLLAKEQDALSEIEQAIARCESGVYGICEMSGEKIPNERLEAIPFARYTVKCQAEWEKDNNGGRHNAGKSEFGFSNGAMR